MKTPKKQTALCQILKQEFPLAELIPLSTVRIPILKMIKTDHPDIDESGFIHLKELTNYRNKYLENLLSEDMGKLSDLEEEVLDSISSNEFISKNIEPEIEEQLTFGQKLADKIAQFGGSWTFILSFMFFLFVWISINVYVLLNSPFDPYPFILLNLILSCIAALQAPLIMMSQNRQETKDRNRSEHDYQINLKAELEIRQIKEKIDHLAIYQNQRLVEIQQIQIELLSDLIENLNKKNNVK